MASRSRVYVLTSESVKQTILDTGGRLEFDMPADILLSAVAFNDKIGSSAVIVCGSATGTGGGGGWWGRRVPRCRSGQGERRLGRYLFSSRASAAFFNEPK